MTQQELLAEAARTEVRACRLQGGAPGRKGEVVRGEYGQRRLSGRSVEGEEESCWQRRLRQTCTRRLRAEGRNDGACTAEGRCGWSLLGGLCPTFNSFSILTRLGATRSSCVMCIEQ
eukprot:44262-Chlamydomonas_euryale.AAC.1